MQELLTRCDAVITSGGVSVGQKDYLPLVLEKLGAQLVVEGVAQKPGSPMLAAALGGKLVFCLSGNPLPPPLHWSSTPSLRCCAPPDAGRKAASPPAPSAP